MATGKSMHGSVVGSTQYLRQITLNTDDAKKIIRTITRSYLDPHHLNGLKVKAIYGISNSALRQSYNARKEQLEKQHGGVKETLGFICDFNWENVTHISAKGLCVRSSSLDSLGPNDAGVYLCCNADVVLQAGIQHFQTNTLWLTLFTVAYSQICYLEARLGSNYPILQPYDCYMPSNPPQPDTSLMEKMIRSHIYAFETMPMLGQTMPYPRQVMPYAVIELHRTSQTPSRQISPAPTIPTVVSHVNMPAPTNQQLHSSGGQMSINQAPLQAKTAAPNRNPFIDPNFQSMQHPTPITPGTDSASGSSEPQPFVIAPMPEEELDTLARRFGAPPTSTAAHGGGGQLRLPVQVTEYARSQPGSPASTPPPPRPSSGSRSSTPSSGRPKTSPSPRTRPVICQDVITIPSDDEDNSQPDDGLQKAQSQKPTTSQASATVSENSPASRPVNEQTQTNTTAGRAESEPLTFESCLTELISYLDKPDGSTKDSTASSSQNVTDNNLGKIASVTDSAENISPSALIPVPVICASSGPADTISSTSSSTPSVQGPSTPCTGPGTSAGGSRSYETFNDKLDSGIAIVRPSPAVQSTVDPQTGDETPPVTSSPADVSSTPSVATSTPTADGMRVDADPSSDTQAPVKSANQISTNGSDTTPVTNASDSNLGKHTLPNVAATFYQDHVRKSPVHDPSPASSPVAMSSGKEKDTAVKKTRVTLSDQPQVSTVVKNVMDQAQDLTSQIDQLWVTTPDGVPYLQTQFPQNDQRANHGKITPVESTDKGVRLSHVRLENQVIKLPNVMPTRANVDNLIVDLAPKPPPTKGKTTGKKQGPQTKQRTIDLTAKVPSNKGNTTDKEQEPPTQHRTILENREPYTDGETIGRNQAADLDFKTIMDNMSVGDLGNGTLKFEGREGFFMGKDTTRDPLEETEYQLGIFHVRIDGTIEVIHERYMLPEKSKKQKKGKKKAKDSAEDTHENNNMETAVDSGDEQLIIDVGDGEFCESVIEKSEESGDKHLTYIDEESFENNIPTPVSESGDEHLSDINVSDEESRKNIAKTVVERDDEHLSDIDVGDEQYLTGSVLAGALGQTAVDEESVSEQREVVESSEQMDAKHMEAVPSFEQRDPPVVEVVKPSEQSDTKVMESAKSSEPRVDEVMDSSEQTDVEVAKYSERDAEVVEPAATSQQQDVEVVKTRKSKQKKETRNIHKQMQKEESDCGTPSKAVVRASDHKDTKEASVSAKHGVMTRSLRTPSKERVVEKSDPSKERAVEKSDPSKERAVEKSDPSKERAVEKSDPSKERAIEKSDPSKERAIEKPDKRIKWPQGVTLKEFHIVVEDIVKTGKYAEYVSNPSQHGYTATGTPKKKRRGGNKWYKKKKKSPVANSNPAALVQSIGQPMELPMDIFSDGEGTAESPTKKKVRKVRGKSQPENVSYKIKLRSRKTSSTEEEPSTASAEKSNETDPDASHDDEDYSPRSSVSDELPDIIPPSKRKQTAAPSTNAVTTKKAKNISLRDRLRKKYAVSSPAKPDTMQISMSGLGQKYKKYQQKQFANLKSSSGDKGDHDKNADAITTAKKRLASKLSGVRPQDKTSPPRRLSFNVIRDGSQLGGGDNQSTNSPKAADSMGNKDQSRQPILSMFGGASSFSKSVFEPETVDATPSTESPAESTNMVSDGQSDKSPPLSSEMEADQPPVDDNESLAHETTGEQMADVESEDDDAGPMDWDTGYDEPGEDAEMDQQQEEPQHGGEDTINTMQEPDSTEGNSEKDKLTEEKESHGETRSIQSLFRSINAERVKSVLKGVTQDATGKKDSTPGSSTVERSSSLDEEPTTLIIDEDMPEVIEVSPEKSATPSTSVTAPVAEDNEAALETNDQMGESDNSSAVTTSSPSSTQGQGSAQPGKVVLNRRPEKRVLSYTEYLKRKGALSVPEEPSSLESTGTGGAKKDKLTRIIEDMNSSKPVQARSKTSTDQPNKDAQPEISSERTHEAITCILPPLKNSSALPLPQFDVPVTVPSTPMVQDNDRKSPVSDTEHTGHTDISDSESEVDASEVPDTQQDDESDEDIGNLYDTRQQLLDSLATLPEDKRMELKDGVETGDPIEDDSGDGNLFIDSKAFKQMVANKTSSHLEPVSAPIVSKPQTNVEEWMQKMQSINTKAANGAAQPQTPVKEFPSSAIKGDENVHQFLSTLEQKDDTVKNALDTLLKSSALSEVLSKEPSTSNVNKSPRRSSDVRQHAYLAVGDFTDAEKLPLFIEQRLPGPPPQDYYLRIDFHEQERERIKLRLNKLIAYEQHLDRSGKEELRKRFKREINRLHIDQEMVQDDLAAARNLHPAFHRLPKNLLLSHEKTMDLDVTENGVPLITLYTMTQDIQKSLLSFKVDIEATENALQDAKRQGNPVKLKKLIEQLEWCQNNRNHNLRKVCDSPKRPREIEELQKKLVWHRYALSQIEDDDSGSEFHLNRILYVQDYITRVERLVRALKMVEERNPTPPTPPKVPPSAVKPEDPQLLDKPPKNIPTEYDKQPGDVVVTKPVAAIPRRLSVCIEEATSTADVEGEKKVTDSSETKTTANSEINPPKSEAVVTAPDTNAEDSSMEISSGTSTPEIILVTKKDPPKGFLEAGNTTLLVKKENVSTSSLEKGRNEKEKDKKSRESDAKKTDDKKAEGRRRHSRDRTPPFDLRRTTSSHRISKDSSRDRGRISRERSSDHRRSRERTRSPHRRKSPSWSPRGSHHTRHRDRRSRSRSPHRRRARSKSSDSSLSLSSRSRSNTPQPRRRSRSRSSRYRRSPSPRRRHSHSYRSRRNRSPTHGRYRSRSRGRGSRSPRHRRSRSPNSQTSRSRSRSRSPSPSISSELSLSTDSTTPEKKGKTKGPLPSHDPARTGPGLAIPTMSKPAMTAVSQPQPGWGAWNTNQPPSTWTPVQNQTFTPPFYRPMGPSTPQLPFPTSQPPPQLVQYPINYLGQSGTQGNLQQQQQQQRQQQPFNYQPQWPSY